MFSVNQCSEREVANESTQEEVQPDVKKTLKRKLDVVSDENVKLLRCPKETVGIDKHLHMRQSFINTKGTSLGENVEFDPNVPDDLD